MILHWLRTGWRSLIANPLFSLITITSLSIGCAGALLAGANIKQHLSFESGFADADRIMLLRMREIDGPGAAEARGTNPPPENEYPYSIRPALKPSMEGQIKGVIAQTRVMSGGSILVDEQNEPTKDSVRFVDPTFFDVFEFKFLQGNRESAFATPSTIILTASKAKELFGAESALGKELKGTKNRIWTVGAVINDPPQPTMFDFKVLVSVSQMFPDESGAMNDWGYILNGGHYIRVGKDVDPKAFMAVANEQIRTVFNQGQRSRYFSPEFKEMAAQMAKSGARIPQPDDQDVRISLMPIKDIHLHPRSATGVTSTGDITMLITLGTAAAALLAVSAFNYVVLSLARALRRQREVGVRKVLGASAGAVARHYLAEAVLVTGISVGIGFALAELLQPWFARALDQPEVLFNLYDPLFLAACIGVLAMLALVVGAYPALYLASTRPRAGLDSNASQGGGRLGRMITSGLLGLEIMAATVLLAVALTMAAQARYVADRPLGFRLEGLHAINSGCGIRSTPKLASSNPDCASTLDRVVRGMPEVKRVAYSSNPAILTTGSPAPISRAMGSQKLGDGFPMAVDLNFLDLTEARLIAGRMFDPNSAYDRRQLDAYPNIPDPLFDSVPVIVTRAMLPILGSAEPEDAISQRFVIGQPRFAKSYEIVGVIEDWHQRSLKFPIAPIVFIPGGTFMNVIAEIGEDDVPTVQRKLTPIGGFAAGTFYGGPAQSMRPTLTSLATGFENSYAGDRRLMFAVMGFAGVAILVACLGVYGLSAFDMRRRVREIGIRKALGATPGKVAGMVLGRQTVFALAASLIGWPIAWWLSSEWINQYVYRTSLGFIILPIATLFVVSFVVLAVGLSAARAAAIRPGFALRAAT
jgi:putative ABC transport system permease protein